MFFWVRAAGGKGRALLWSKTEGEGGKRDLKKKPLSHASTGVEREKIRGNVMEEEEEGGRKETWVEREKKNRVLHITNLVVMYKENPWYFFLGGGGKGCY